MNRRFAALRIGVTLLGMAGCLKLSSTPQVVP